MFLNLLALSAFALEAYARNNGVGKLPVMGYDTYNAFNDQFNASLTIEQARLMKEYGLVDAGYNTVRTTRFAAETRPIRLIRKVHSG